MQTILVVKYMSKYHFTKYAIRYTYNSQLKIIPLILTSFKNATKFPNNSI